MQERPEEETERAAFARYGSVAVAGEGEEESMGEREVVSRVPVAKAEAERKIAGAGQGGEKLLNSPVLDFTAAGGRTGGRELCETWWSGQSG